MNSSYLSHHPLPSISKENYYQLYKKNSTFAAVRFILECCEKLECKYLLNS